MCEQGHEKAVLDICSFANAWATSPRRGKRHQTNRHTPQEWPHHRNGRTTGKPRFAHRCQDYQSLDSIQERNPSKSCHERKLSSLDKQHAISWFLGPWTRMRRLLRAFPPWEGATCFLTQENQGILIPLILYCFTGTCVTLEHPLLHHDAKIGLGTQRRCSEPKVGSGNQRCKLHIFMSCVSECVCVACVSE